jgi:hypothetical protein
MDDDKDTTLADEDIFSMEEDPATPIGGDADGDDADTDADDADADDTDADDA